MNRNTHLPMDDTDNNEIQMHTENSPLISTPKQVGDDEEKGKNNTLDDNNDTSSILEDVADTFNLAVPIFISRVSYVGMKTTDTALLGHVSGHALSAAALSDLYTMCTGVLIQGRVLGIIVGQAIGAGNQQLALIYLRISFLILGVLSIFVMISWSFTEQIWIWLGQDSDIAKDAGYYSMIFILSIPPRLGFSQLSQYLSAQRIMKPEVYTSLIALLCNLILGFVLVLGIPFGNGYGFKACPLVTVGVVWCQCIILFSYWVKSGDNTALDSSSSSQAPYSPTKPSQWISIWTEQITMERIRTYTDLYFPAALAISSDFWRMGVIGAIAARLGETEVGLFNASYRILWITLIFIGSLSGASGIKIALRLGKGKAFEARQAAAVGLALQLLFLLTLSLIVYYNIRMFGQLFTNDESYLNLFEECRLPFTCVLFFMNLSVGIETIPISMGQTGNVFYAGFVASWLGQVPFVILLVYLWQDLYAIYTGVAVGYFILTIIYGWLAYTSDFVKYSDMARQRAEQ